MNLTMPMPDAGKRPSPSPCTTPSLRCATLLCFAMLLAAGVPAVTRADESISPESVSPLLTQRLSAARAALASTDGSLPAQASAQAAAIERLFDLLEESAQLESDE